MEFFKPGFLAFFLVAFAVYWRLSGHNLRMGWLLIASAAYYAAFSPWFLVLLFASTFIDYVVAARLPSVRSPATRKWMLILSISVNLGVLGFFKYLMFALHTGRALAGVLGWGFDVPAWKVVLPLGISFYTFEAISYVVDVYRGKVEPFKNLREYLLYIMFFPHLLAGPIVRSHDFAPQLRRPKRFSWLRAEMAAHLFLLGLFKKAVLGDWMASLVDPVFATPSAYGSQALWLAMVGYAVQVYGDFSGYSDMAIALAHLFGFKLPPNFQTPYLSTSMAELWRRWHISLSLWLRDYLFIPLGGSRHGEWITCRNLILTMALGGLWHGAAWNFVLWGLYNGVLLALGRIIPVPNALKARWLAPAWCGLTFLAFCIGLVVFRCQTLVDTGIMLSRLALPVAGKALAAEQSCIILLALAAVFGGGLIGNNLDWRRFRERLPATAVATGLAAFALIYVMLLPPKASGFIYFHF